MPTTLTIIIDTTRAFLLLFAIHLSAYVVFTPGIQAGYALLAGILIGLYVYGRNFYK